MCILHTYCCTINFLVVNRVWTQQTSYPKIGFPRVCPNLNTLFSFVNTWTAISIFLKRNLANERVEVVPQTRTPATILGQDKVLILQNKTTILTKTSSLKSILLQSCKNAKHVVLSHPKVQSYILSRYTNNSKLIKADIS